MGGLAKCPGLRGHGAVVSGQGGAEGIGGDGQGGPCPVKCGEVGGEVVLINPNQKLTDLFAMYRFGQFMKICEEAELDAYETKFPQ
mgnify:CR=1 FL=1